MARYIDADEFFQTLGFYEQSFDENRDFSARQTILQIMHELEHAPTADVVEVKHGEWKKRVVENNGIARPSYICSNCGKRRFVLADYNYCPHCGAKMDGMNLSELPTD